MKGRAARAGPKRMPDLLGRLLGSEAKRRGLAEARLLTDWASVIGESIAARCQPVSLSRHGVLHLDVTGGAALELQHAELQVIERINVFFGRPTVTRLHLRQAPPKRRILTPPPVPRPELDPAEKAAIGRSVEGVGDPELRRALASLGQTLGRKAKASRR
ncbi:MAG: DciA family protein [Alphaproteobacteria bacterium]